MHTFGNKDWGTALSEGKEARNRALMDLVFAVVVIPNLPGFQSWFGPPDLSGKGLPHLGSGHLGAIGDGPQSQPPGREGQAVSLRLRLSTVQCVCPADVKNSTEQCRPLYRVCAPQT